MRRVAGRVRAGEAAAAVGGAVVLLALLIPWYAIDEAASTPDVVEGYDALREAFGIGDPGRGIDATGAQALSRTDLVLALAAGGGLALPALSVLLPDVGSRLLAAGAVAVLGALGAALVLARIVDQPGPDALVLVRAGAVIGLLGAAAVAAGGVAALRGIAPPPDGS